MKIFLISNMYPSSKTPSYGVFVKNFVQQLEDNHFTFCAKSVIKGRKTNYLLKIVDYLIFYGSITINLIKGGYNIVYVHQVSHSSLPLFLLSPLIRKKKLIINFHGDDVYLNTLFTRLLNFMIRRMVLKSDLVVVPSKHFARIVSLRFGVDNDKIFVSPSGGVDLNVFRPIPRINDGAKEGVTLGYFGRFDEGKGIECLLKALPLIAYPVKHFIFIGDGKYLPRLKVLKNLPFRLTFFPTMNQAELVKYFNELDFFIYPTERESLGLIGLEAMACGIPVVGSDIPGPSEYLKDKYNGFVFEVNNEISLKSSLVKAMNLSMNDQQIMKNNAIETARQFGKDTISKNLINRITNLYV